MNKSYSNSRLGGTLNDSVTEISTEESPMNPDDASEHNPFSVRLAILDDSPMIQSIEQEAFPILTPVTRLPEDFKRENRTYLVAVRQWNSEEISLGPRLAITTKTEREDNSFKAQARRRIGRYFLDYLHRPQFPPDYIVGFAGVWFVFDEAHLVVMGLREADRRKGIGEQLLISVLKNAFENDSRVVTLEVRESNRAAIELYRKYGFQQVGLRLKYYSDTGEHALIMTTPPIHTDDYQVQLSKLINRHVLRWGSA